jgi:signal transduction histidine kinase
MEFMPHGHCYYWEPSVLWSHVIGDGLTVMAYYAIPFLLVRFVSLRKDLEFKGIFFAFAAFIVSCGTVHLFAIFPTWNPFYRVEGVLKLSMAGISLYTVYLLYRNFPKMLAIPNPSELVALNEQLSEEVRRHKETQKVFVVKNELEYLVKKRTAELEETNKELEAFSYSVSHDLRAPLRAISGYSNIVKNTYADKLDEDGKQMLNHVIKNTTNMGALIDGLLEFSRLGRKGLTAKTINTTKLVTDIWQEVWQDAGEPNVAVNIGDLPDMQADELLMSQVWHNLISNAIKYSSKKPEPSIRIAGQKVGKNLEFTIADNGVGFDEKYGDKVFGVFQRLHTSKDFEGIGVGLSFVKRIILKHKGKTWATSKLGSGATFHFSIPMNPTSSIYEG